MKCHRCGKTCRSSRLCRISIFRYVDGMVGGDPQVFKVPDFSKVIPLCKKCASEVIKIFKSKILREKPKILSR